MPSGPRSGWRLTHIVAHCVRAADDSEPSPELVALVRNGPLDGLVDEATRHRVAGGVLAELAKIPGVDRGVLDGLRARHQRDVAFHLQAMADLAVIGRILDRAAVPWLVVKGPVLAEAVYRTRWTRSYADLDIVVPPEHFGSVLSLLENHCCHHREAKWRALGRERDGELTDPIGQIHLLLPHGTPCDYHWHLLYRDRIRKAFGLPMAAMFSRARTVSLGDGAIVRTLDPADTLIHLAVHACLSGGRRLVWLEDVDQLVRHTTVPWTQVVERARTTGAALAVGLILTKARLLLGADVPDAAIRALAGRNRWSSTVRLADAASRGVEGCPGALVARSTRATVMSSAMAVCANLATSVRDRGRPRHTDDTGAPRTDLVPDAGDPYRRAYLDAVGAYGRAG